MKISKKSLMISAIILVLSISTVFLIFKEKKSIPSTFQRIDPIQITSNSDFEAYNFPGNGTIGNPYIIEGYGIERNGENTQAIAIKNTDVYFIIRNCYILTDCVGISILNIASGTCEIIGNICVSKSNDGGGIQLGRLTNASIINNSCSLFMQGIHLNGAAECLIQENQITNNYYQGINIRNSNNNTIIDNYIKSNSQHGVALVTGSSNNLVYNNTFIDNGSEESYMIDGARSGTIQSQSYDEGTSNYWYSTYLTLGNNWDGHASTSNYVIDGPSESEDLYPIHT